MARAIEPIDRTELRETIQNWIEAHSDIDDYAGVGLLEDVLWEIDAQTMLTHPNEWISVKDRMPESDLPKDSTKLCETLYALADMVNQFAYSTTFYGKDAVCDGGLSALENAFWVLEQAGCKINSNGTIQRKNLLHFIEIVDRQRRNKNGM